MTDVPLRLSTRERTILIVLTLSAAVTRLLPLARSIWEWDEALFSLALRDYDVAQHHPHPPGFPLFIAAAKLVSLLINSEFRALQTVTVVASVFLLPALFFFARELGLRFSTSISAATIFSFLPNVWYFGGTGFSDIPSIVLVLAACTLLLRGRTSRRAYFAGTLVLAIAIGVRPQNLLVGIAPGLLASRRRKPLDVAIAALLGACVVAIAFGGAVVATGSFERWADAVRHHGEYIARVDSWRSDVRPPLWRIFDRFFVTQYQSPFLGYLTTLLVIVGAVAAVRHRIRALGIAALTFVPFALFAWLMLDRYSISRFSIAYQPMFVLFAAEGVRRVAAWRREKDVWKLEAALAALLVTGFVAYALPSFRTVRGEISPTAAAVAAARDTAGAGSLYVAHSMTPFVDLLAPELRYVKVVDSRSLPLSAAAGAWLLAEMTRAESRQPTKIDGLQFRRERGHLWNIARRQYFDIKLERVGAAPRFGDGWYAPERTGDREWRWMRGRSFLELPPTSGPQRLRLHLGIPAELIASSTIVDVWLNGAQLASVTGSSGDLALEYDVIAVPGKPNLLEIAISRTVPAQVTGDRELGLRLIDLGWGPR